MDIVTMILLIQLILAVVLWTEYTNKDIKEEVGSKVQRVGQLWSTDQINIQSYERESKYDKDQYNVSRNLVKFMTLLKRFGRWLRNEIRFSNLNTLTDIFNQTDQYSLDTETTQNKITNINTNIEYKNR